MARSRKTKEKTTITIPDLSKVEARVIIPEGRYLFEITGIEEGEGDSGPYYRWKTEIAKGKHKGAKPKDYITSLSPDSLWNLRALLEACEVDIPDEETELEKDEMIGKQFWSEIIHEEYNNRTQSNLNGSFEPANAGDDEDDDEKSSKKKKKDEKYTQDQINDMDEDELEDLNNEHKLKVDLEDYTSIKKKRNAIFDALEGKDLIEEE